MQQPDAGPPGQSREVLRLAVPAFFALVAEPLFLLADSAIIGHLGTTELAGLGVASAILLTAAGIFVFLAYGTTAVVSRQLGAGSEKAAVEAGIDGTWLAVGLGIITGVLVFVAADPLCRVFGASDAVIDQAVTYLRVSSVGIPGMLVTLAITGVLRGLQDTMTPLIASVIGFGSNIAMNIWFVFGLDMGIAGAAWGTVIAQTGMAIGLVVVMLRKSRGRGASVRATFSGIMLAARDGMPLLVRTLALRATILVTMWVAAGLGEVPLAGHQVAVTIWSFLAFALDALAIAAQAITGKALGGGDVALARTATTLMVRWGVVAGLVLGFAVLLSRTVLPNLFTTDPAVRNVLAGALLIVALVQPLSGYVFVLDGVLIGAGDAPWLARAMVLNFVAYLPFVLGVHWAGDWLLSDTDVIIGQRNSLIWLWLAFTAFMAIRAGLLGMRSRTDLWLVTGGAPGR